MMKRKSLMKKITAVALSLAMVAGMVLQYTKMVSHAAEALTMIVDPNTGSSYNDDNFLGHEYSTEFAGRIWSDKTITIAENNNFLVKYSALATSKAVTGQTNAPVDVVFVIDTSGSMSYDVSDTDNTSRIEATIDALNASIQEVMELNPYTRVAVVAFSNTSEILLPLGRYEKGTRTTGNFFNPQTITNYFSATSETVYVHVKEEGKTQQITDTRSVTGGTNIQYGYYEGLNILAEEDSTAAEANGTRVNRVPALIFLSDGAPTYSSSSSSWWAPENNKDDGPGSNPSNNYYIGNGFKALLTAAYMKEAVNRNYANKIAIYTVGMGISELSGNEKNLAYVTLAPNENWNAANNVATDFRSAWATYITNNGTPSINVGANNGWSYSNDYYTVTHPTGNAAQYDIDGDVDALKNLVNGYYDADDAATVSSVFDEIVSTIALNTPEVPTEVKVGETLASGGYLTYTDPIGMYMQVKGTSMSYKYKGTTYTASDTDGDGEYLFDNDPSVIGSDGQEHKLNLIKLKVTTTAEGNQVVEMKIPAILIPLRVNEILLNPNGQIVSHTHNGMLPCELTYLVGMIPDIYDEDTNSIHMIPSDAEGHAWTGEKLEAYQQYLAANTDAETGTVRFYAGLYTGENKVVNNKTGIEHTVGNATVTFEPSHTNAFYYIQEDMCVYADPELTTPVTADELDDNTTYYYKEVFYHVDDIEVKAVARTGAQLKKVSTLKDPATGQWYREEGTVRRNKLQLFENQKDPNATGTAQDYYASVFIKEAGATDEEGYFTVYFGNNGLLTAKVTGNLTITKVVTAGEGIVAPDKEFTFTVDLNGTQGRYSYRIVDELGAQLFGGMISDGETIVLKKGQTAEIANLPANTAYEITETSVAGFSTTAIGASGTILAGNTSKAVFTNAYAVTPIIVTSADFSAKKTLEGRGWNSEDSYTFILESNRVTTPMPSGAVAFPNATNATHMLKEVTVTSDAVFGFGDITFTAPGTYVYTISERIPTPGIAGISYSGAMYQVTVIITDNGAGTLSKSVVMKQLRNDAGTTAGVESFTGTTAEFVNTFDADHVEWTPVGTKDYKDYSGTNPLKNGMFEFEMKQNSQTPNAPMPSSAVNGVTTDVNIGPEIGYDTITFGPQHIASNEPGKAHASIYYYDFTEKLAGTGANAGNNYTVKGMKYDPSVLTVKVYVYYNANMEIVVEPEYPTVVDGTHYNRVVFFNEYKPESVTLGNDTNSAIQGTKTLVGRDWKANDSFEFVLGTTDAATQEAIRNGIITGFNTSDLTNLMSAVATNANKNFEFGNITFTKPGTYHFTIKEKAGTLGGVTYDTHTTGVTVIVADTDSDADGTKEGKLVATVTYNNTAATTEADRILTDKAAFTNVYAASASAPINISGTKTLTGRDMRDGEFFLNIEAQLIAGSTTEYAPMGDSRPGNGAPAAQSGVESAAITLLNNISYTKVGSYVYLIKEHIPADNQKIGGITYDVNTVYRVTVVVTDNGEGRLIATPSVAKSVDKGVTWNDVTVNDIKFYNSYSVNQVTYEPVHLWKQFEGKDLEGGDFTFKMESVKDDVNGMILPTQTEVTNQTTGEIIFGNITFTKPGQYQVKVTEVVPTNKNAGITYSENELVVEFDVTDNGYGELTVRRSIVSGNIIFVNVYETEGTLSGATNLEIQKEFTGRENNAWLDTDEFTFVLVPGSDEAIAGVQDGTIDMNGAETGTPDKVTVTIGDTTEAQGKAFGDMVFTKPGTYEFKLYEDSENGIEHVKYDDAVRTVTVTAVDNGDGTMTVTATVTGGTLTFKNSFEPPKPPQTGDNQNAGLWTAMAAGSAVACVALFVGKKKEEEAE